MLLQVSLCVSLQPLATPAWPLLCLQGVGAHIPGLQSLYQVTLGSGTEYFMCERQFVAALQQDPPAELRQLLTGGCGYNVLHSRSVIKDWVKPLHREDGEQPQANIQLHRNHDLAFAKKHEWRVCQVKNPQRGTRMSPGLLALLLLASYLNALASAHSTSCVTASCRSATGRGLKRRGGSWKNSRLPGTPSQQPWTTASSRRGGAMLSGLSVYPAHSSFRMS